MAKKIEGWVRPAGIDVNGPGYELGSGCGWCEFNECGQPEHGDTKATLVIGEKAFTESEVRAMLDEIQGLAQAYWDNAGHGAPDMLSASEVAGIAERGGIVLDSA